MQGVIQKIFLGGSRIKKCDQYCDQAFKKAAEDLYRVYIY